LVTNGESITLGEALSFSGGRLTKANPTGAVAAVAMQSVAAGTDKKCKVAIVYPQQVWRVRYTGTPAAGFVVGSNSATIDATGMFVDASNVTSGPCAVIAIDAAAGTCDVIFKNRQLN